MGRLSLDEAIQVMEQRATSGSNQSQFEWLKLPNKGSVNVRFMYGPGEGFEGIYVHELVQGDKGKGRKLQVCLRDNDLQPVSDCPLCKAGYARMVKFFIPCYDIDNNKILLFERGIKFSYKLASIQKQCAGTPLVSNVFEITRHGQPGSTDTEYEILKLRSDSTTLESLPERPQFIGRVVKTYTVEQLNTFLTTGQLPQVQQSQQQNQGQQSTPAVVPRSAGSVQQYQPVNQQAQPSTVQQVGTEEIPF